MTKKRTKSPVAKSSKKSANDLVAKMEAEIVEHNRLIEPGPDELTPNHSTQRFSIANPSSDIVTCQVCGKLLDDDEKSKAVDRLLCAKCRPVMDEITNPPANEKLKELDDAIQFVRQLIKDMGSAKESLPDFFVTRCKTSVEWLRDFPELTPEKLSNVASIYQKRRRELAEFTEQLIVELASRMQSKTEDLLGFKADEWRTVHRRNLGISLKPISVNKAVIASSLGNGMKKHDNAKNTENKIPLNQDVIELCRFIKNQKEKNDTLIGFARKFCRKNQIPVEKAENLLRQAKRFPHLWKT